MNNGDKPAYPQSFAGDALHGMHTSSEKNEANAGMSKREMFAMAAMQGLLSNSFYAQHVDGDLEMDKSLSKRSIEIADELLKALES